MSKKECIAFYISSHGFGHLTRSLALIEYLLQNTSYSIYLCSGEVQVSYAKIYMNKYSDRVCYSVQKTDVGLINQENSLCVNLEETNREVKNLLSGYPEVVESETKKLKLCNVVLILSDISALAFLVGKSLSVKTIGIANFTWVDQYLGIGADEEIIEQMKKIYSYGDYYIKYDLSLPFSGAPEGKIEDSNFIVSRPIVESRIQEIREECKALYEQKTGSKEFPEILLLTLGQSANLPPIRLTNFKGVVLYTQGVNIQEDSQKNYILQKIPYDVEDTQSYIAAADMVISKAGWSSVAESLVAHRYLFLIEREGVDDDTNTIETLCSRGLAAKLKQSELKELNYSALKERAEKYIQTDKLFTIKNNTKNLCNKIIELINK